MRTESIFNKKFKMEKLIKVVSFYIFQIFYWLILLYIYSFIHQSTKRNGTKVLKLLRSFRCRSQNFHFIWPIIKIKSKWGLNLEIFTIKEFNSGKMENIIDGPALLIILKSKVQMVKILWNQNQKKQLGQIL